jgi:hypothetical protein
MESLRRQADTTLEISRQKWSSSRQTYEKIVLIGDKPYRNYF